MRHQCYCGKIYLEKKEYKNAIDTFTNLVKYKDEDYLIYYKLGICYSRINDFNVAKQCFQKVIELDENMYLAYYRLGQIALLYRDFDVAEENFLKSIYNEKEAKSYLELAKIHVMKNQKEKAISDINKAIKADSRFYEIALKEPMIYPIKQHIEKPEMETKIQYNETQEEKEIEEYLNNTYNLTKVLNRRKEEYNRE